MRKVLAIAVFLCGTIQSLFAEHIKGGEMFYEYLGPGATANTSQYRITLKLYIDCNATSPGQLDNQINLTVYDKGNLSQVAGSPFNAPMVNEVFARFDPNSNPCITNPPTHVCYRIPSFQTTITVNINSQGYTG